MSAKLKLVGFFLGLGLLLVAAMSWAANHSAGTAGHPAHLAAMGAVALAGVALLFLCRGQDISHLQHDLAQKLAAVSGGRSLQTADGKTAAPDIRAHLLNPRGRFIAPSAEKEDTDALYHLAEKAASQATPQRGQMLRLCRQLNDELFVLHHDPNATPMEGTDNGKKPAAPDSAKQAAAA
jgi:hypothetical protein